MHPTSAEPEPVQRRRVRQGAHLLALLLGNNPDLPALAWMITPQGVVGRADLTDSYTHNRQAFTAWVQALELTDHSDPEPAGWDWQTYQLRAHRRINGMAVFITATLRPF